MLRLTWRNLLARKVRLLMSTLAIVLGIGFLAGVMTFSTGLNSTFDNIVEGSTPDAQVRPAGDVAGRQRRCRYDVADHARRRREARRPARGRGRGRVGRRPRVLPPRQGRQAGRRPGRPDPGLQLRAQREHGQGEQILQLVEGGWPEKPGEVTLDASSAERGGYAIGDTVTMITPTAQPRRTFTLVGTAELQRRRHRRRHARAAGHRGGAGDLPRRQGRLHQRLADRRRRRLPDRAGRRRGRRSCRTASPPSPATRSSRSRRTQIGQFLDVISIFLTTFAVIAIVVGAFIIFNTFSILVSQRVRESALLRALGASKKQVTRSVLVEAFLMSVVGATLGLLLGLGLSRLLAGLFRTFGLDIAGDVLTLTPFTIVAGYVVGILVTMVAAFVPARRAAKVPPVAAMRDDLVVQEKGMGRRLVLGTIAMVVGVALVAAGLVGAPGTDAIWIGAGAVIWVVTTAVLAPVLGNPVLRRLPQRSSAGCSARPDGWPGENALRNPRRTGATASALMIGLAVVSAVGVLASSLSATNDETVDDAVHAATSSSRCRPSRASRRSTATRWSRSTASTWSRASRACRSASRSTASPTRPSPTASTRPSSRSTTLTMVDGTDDDLGRPGAPQRGPCRRPRGPASATPSTWSSPAGRRSRWRSRASSRTRP